LDIFQFKKFKIKQNSASVFKVNTEAVLLSAWVTIEPQMEILEIGSGSGVISLGLVQRIDISSNITTIDIDKNAYALTIENLELNQSTNIYALHRSIQEYYQENSTKRFDLIISNPPYFNYKSKSVKPRNVFSKYTDSLDYATLIELSNKLLKSEGRIAIIIPYEDLKKMNIILQANQLHILRALLLSSVPHKLPLRILLEIKKGSGKEDFLMEELLVNDQEGQFTEEYKRLTKDYYTIF
jgi:tRNA1Val (adenine37-N6)-methyltransferase